MKPTRGVQTPNAHGAAPPGCSIRNRRSTRVFLPLLFTGLLLAGLTTCSEVNVTAVDVAQLHVEPLSLELTVGDTAKLSATPLDAQGNTLTGRAINWTTSDPAVATVLQDGRVVAQGAGNATITAESEGVAGQASVNIAGVPVIAADPPSVAFNMAQGAALPGPLTINVRNDGEGSIEGLAADVSYASGQPSGWLTAELAHTRAPTTLAVRVRDGSLARGTYNATVRLISTTPRVAQRNISVTLEVGAALPRIVLGKQDIEFTALAGGPDPQPQSFSVQNGGGGTLSGLGTSITYGNGQPVDWLAASLSPSTAPGTLTLSARTGNLAPGRYTATVNVVSTVAANSPQSVNVSFVVSQPASTIELSNTAAAFVATAGRADPPAQTITVTNSGAGTLTDLTATVRYGTGEPAGWLTATLSSTTAPTDLTLQPHTGSLGPGTYTASVEIAAPNTTNSPRTVSVAFTVNPPVVAPSLALSATSATFAATEGGGDPGAQTIDVTNAGGGALGGLAVAINYTSGQPTGWLSATLSGTAAPATLTLQPATGSLTAGTYTATVDVSATGVSNSPQTVTVTFNVAPPAQPPAIGLTSTSVTFNATAGGSNPGSQTVAVANSGGGTLDQLALNIAYGASQPTGWLTATLDATTAPATITLQAAVGSLAAGTYNATVEVTSPVAANSPQSIAVTFDVAAAPTPAGIALSSSTESFNAVLGGADPSARTVNVSNSGGGTLNQLTSAVRYTSGQPTGWLTATLGATAAPTALTLQPRIGSLGAGSYQATVEIASSMANNSPQTVDVAFSISAGNLPSAPSNLDADRGPGRRSVRLRWRDNSNDETSFVVQRLFLPFVQWTTIATLPANTKDYEDRDVSRMITYFYRVLACNPAGCTSSNTVFITL